ncbi:MAG TPA: molybdopterin cofactor-binding domain-containing protein [Burkholderiales bacterium]|nr:molybdopterin cofactor-binding domain-containing protein [Burkholderiales bacterium]
MSNETELRSPSTLESRRAFLKTSGALVVTFTLAHPLSNLASAAASPGKTVAANEVDGFVAIDGNGRVTIYSGKVDLGTGTSTALVQIAAEELCVPMSRVELVEGDTALTPDQGTTWGSLTIQVGGMQIRRACATAREMLLARGAEKLGVAAAAVYAEDGEVRRQAGGPGIAYAQLIGGQSFEMKVNDKVKLKPVSSYVLVGHPIRRRDIPEKVTGQFTYMQDMKVSGMVHARVIRPAAMKATLQSVDDSAAKKVPGYLSTVRKGDFLAVVARDEWAAIRCANAVRARWSDWQGLPEMEKLWDHVRATKVVKDEVFQNVGNVAAVKNAAKTLSATYDFAIHTHGSIGPSCAIAEYKDGRMTVWSSSQATHLLRKQLANMLSMKVDNVRCLYVEGAGCYGRNGHEDAAADAALLAAQLGRPVRVQWSRQDEHGWDPKGPPTLLEHRAQLDANGNVLAWESYVYIPDRPKGFEVTLVAAELAGMPKDTAFPGNIHQALAIPYAFPNVKATAKWLAETPFKPSWIRTPGRMQNTYANESFMDEIAASAGIDPIQFRLRNLKDARGIECIERCAKLAKWTPRGGGAREGGEIAKGRGFSYIKYELVRTYVAVVADVEVNRRTGDVRVTNFYCAHDCGQIINPDGLKNQIEGNIVQTVSRTLIEELKFDRSRVTSVDWESYPILRFAEVPEIAMDLISRPNEAPWGAGEPAAAVVPSAIANAIYDAVGVRMRSVPFTPAKVLAAMKT